MENRSRMRIFLEFVSCCATPTRHTLESSTPAEDQERWLVPAPAVSTTSASVSSRYRYRKKQRKGPALDWRPSLGPISEDISVPTKSAMVVSREVKKKTVARGGGPAKVYHRSYSDGYYGSSSTSMIMPAFSPTPFMF